MKKLTTQSLLRLSPEAFQVVLDNVRSGHNVGAAFRLADAFLIEQLYLCGITAQPPHREIRKTALGAEETVAWKYAPDTLALLRQLKAAGYILAAVEQTDQRTALQSFVPSAAHKYGLVFGHEVSGISETALSACDLSLEIPQHGVKHSLNVSVSMGIVLWEMSKKLGLHAC